MATKAEKEHLIEVLKFTPRTYKVRLWGYGGEVVLGEINKKTWDYFREHRIDLGDYACDSDFGEGLEVPEDCQPFYPGQWHDCDNLYHGWGVSKNAGTLQIEDENGDVVYERELDSLDGCDVGLSCNDEAWIEMKGNNSYVFYNYSSEKGTFFEADLELTMPFDPEKLCINYDEVEGEELVTGVEYDGETLDNWGGDTTGKGYDLKFYHVKDDGSVESYADGSDVDEDFDDGTPPMGTSPSDWEKSAKMIGVNPVYTGWYNCHWRGTTYGSLYWNNEKNVWEDYYHGRVVATYEIVDWWTGYNWDTSSWVNQPPEPPNVICKKCKHVGDSEKMERNDDYDIVCPECGGTKTDWIDYDPETKKGLANRKKYCKEWDPAVALERIPVPADLDTALNTAAAVWPGFPTANEIEELENDIEENEVTTESKSKWWTVKTYHKKNCEQQEYFIQREGNGRIKVTDGFRWCEYNVETNDGEFPKFEFTQVPGGNAAKDSLDMNSLSGSNIESSELVSMDDGGCWGGWEIEGVSEEEEEKLNEFLEENGSWALEDEGEWYLDETEVWVWGPLEVSDDEGNVRIIIADENGNMLDFKEE